MMKTIIKISVVALLAVLCIYLVTNAKKTSYYPLTVIVELKSSEREERCQIFYSSKSGFSEAQSIVKPYSGDTLQEITFVLPAKKIRNIRIDPGFKAARYEVKRIVFQVENQQKVFSGKEIPVKFTLTNIVADTSAGSRSALFIASPNPDVQMICNQPAGEMLDLIKSTQTQWWLIALIIAVYLFVAAIVFMDKKQLIKGIVSFAISSKNRIGRYIDPGLNMLLAAIFLIVLLLILSMAFISSFNAHPDEYVHAAAVKYYQNHWLPPAVNDPEIRKSFSVYGHSRLTDFDLYYFFNGKFSVLVGYVLSDSLLSMRLFNISLFLILIVLFLKESRKIKPLFLVLLISPQIWYLFSYVNSDAFALLLSMLIVYQLVNDNSSFSKFLVSPKTSGYFQGVILMSLLLALQIFSKKNYYLILVFFAIIMILKFIDNKGHRKSISLKCLVLIGLTLLFLMPRYLYDVKLHGFNRGLMISKYEEKYARNRFKHSEKTLETSYFGLFLKEKGVKYSELFSEKWNWHTKTAMSFFGIYGYMSIRSPNLYYRIMYFLISILIGYMTVFSLVHKPPTIKLLPLIFFSLLFFMIYRSSYFSWVSDFQPQGRYLFPILGVLGYWFTKNPGFDKSILFKLMIVFIALTSLYSFVFVAIPNIPKV